jgi:hypothetical protein
MIKAKQQNTEFKKDLAPLPEGTYTVAIEELKEWKKNTKAIEQINAKDSKGNLLKDDDGKIVKDSVPNYTFYTLDMKMKVVEGEHKGRVIYGSLTTHDNVLFLTEGFLYAMGIDELNNIDDIYNKNLIGRQLKVETQNQPYTKTVEDKDSGTTTEVEKIRIRIKKYIKSNIVKENA